VRPSSPHLCSRATRPRRGFTLLEVTIAMTFVALLAAGITLSISTCLKVWQRSVESADLNQEARAVLELLSRDIRGSYLGLDKRSGYFVGVPVRDDESAADSIVVCTESSSLSRVAFLPAEAQDDWNSETNAPATDYVVVGYELVRSADELRPGLYRVVGLVPNAQAETLPSDLGLGEMSPELVSPAVVSLQLDYFDGYQWLDYWETTEDAPVLPSAVSLEVALRDARGRDHAYSTIVPIPTR